ncbi:MAG: beta-galactosidase, partial [Candidatus Glassbacteria bacterium]
MQLRHHVLLFAALFTLAAGCSVSRSADVLVLDDFETDKSLGNWSGPVSLSAEYTAHGRSCLAVDLGDRSNRKLATTSFPHDWSRFELLKFSLYNPGSRIMVAGVQINDELADDEAAYWQGQSYRGGKIFMIPGWNHYEFRIKTAMVEEGNRPLAADRIRSFEIDFGRTGGDRLFLDNFRLVSGDEDQSTASSAEPGHCLVVIDNRDVYPQLYGPADKIVTSPEIAELRGRAQAETARLKSLIEQAGRAGRQTLYERIPLETARIGLEVRSGLVWFQNEKAEKEILDYVIESSRSEADRLEKALAGRIPETVRVQPLPTLKGLKPRDGFFRYEDGRPVMFLAMHGVSRGPLLDYFAPYDHVHESYTVGGGSRGDIESSPVYEAFHKYPDTHRVGWDGWCGHLIKDRWSMGGRKETVVICLESPHIRQAVLEYMKTSCERWKKMPNLMYNIMAYELMYICYCETSQQMFRDWLREKYGSIEKVNAIWGTGYADFSELTAPPTKNAAPVPDVNRAAWYDWACFNTRRFTDYLKWVKSEIRKIDPDIPITAGGTSSMLSAANSTTGIDEEMIINEVDDVVLNESGGSQIFSDLFLSLRDENKVMVEPEMGSGSQGLLLHYLHGKSTIAKWLWREQNSSEFPTFAASSIPISWDIPLSGVAEVLKVALDVRRLAPEIAEFTRPEPEVAIFYSKTNIVQVPPQLHRAGRTPYLDALQSVWEGSRRLGCRVGFISERQILAGKADKLKLLILPAVKYMRPEVTDRIFDYVNRGGTAVVIAESFLFDEYARQHDESGRLGIKIKDVILPEVLGEGEELQNYDQSITQTIVYGEVGRKIAAGGGDIFSGRQASLRSKGLAQKIEAGKGRVIAAFEDGTPAIVMIQSGKGSIYYLAAPLEAEDYHQVLAPLTGKLHLRRPLVGVSADGSLVTGAEVRSVEREADYLVYASNLGREPVEFALKGEEPFGRVTDLRSREELAGGQIR